KRRSLAISARQANAKVDRRRVEASGTARMASRQSGPGAARLFSCATTRARGSGVPWAKARGSEIGGPRASLPRDGQAFALVGPAAVNDSSKINGLIFNTER